MSGRDWEPVAEPAATTTPPRRAGDRVATPGPAIAGPVDADPESSAAWLELAAPDWSVGIEEADRHAAELAAAGSSPATMYLVRLGDGSRRTMRAALGRLVVLAGYDAEIEEFPWHRLRYQHTQRLRALLQQPPASGAEPPAAATVNKHLSALRGILREAWRLGLLGGEDYQRAVDVANLTGQRDVGRSLGHGEVTALFAACAADPSPAGRRDAALLALLYGAGLRRGEAVARRLGTTLADGDYDPATGELRVRRPKRGKDRRVYLTGGAKQAMDDWLVVRGTWPGALLVPVDKAGRLQRRAMTDQAVVYILRKRARQATVGAFTPHDLRRTTIGDLLDAGADLAAVSKLAGHASPTTTIRYDRRGERAKRAAAERLHVPYQPPAPRPHA
jgi:site-specific recombinase XerD